VTPTVLLLYTDYFTEDQIVTMIHSNTLVFFIKHKKLAGLTFIHSHSSVDEKDWQTREFRNAFAYKKRKLEKRKNLQVFS